MKLVRTVGFLSRLNLFLATCCIGGDFQPDSAARHISPSLGFAPLQEDNPYAALLHKIEELSELSGFKPQRERVRGVVLPDVETEHWFGELGARITSIHAERQDLAEQLSLCENAMEQYRHFVGLDTPLEQIFSCEYIKVRFGRLPKESAQKLALYADNPNLLFIPCTETETDEYGAYFAPRNYADEADRVFASLFFERLWIPGAVGRPRDVLAHLEQNNAILTQEIKSLDKRSRALWEKESDRFNKFYSQLFYLSELFDLRRYAVVHGDSFFYTGWVPADKMRFFARAIDAMEGVTFEAVDPETDDNALEAPVRLHNPRIFRPFEYLVGMFGLPSQSDVDVTPFVAITYTLIFGVMFGDVGQGVVILLIGLFMHFAMKNKMGVILAYSGGAAIAGGFVYGSFFGYEDKLDFIYHALGMAGKPVHVMESINGLLIMSIAIGVLMVLAAMAINIITAFKNHHIGEALFGANGFAGMAFYASGVLFAADFMGAPVPVPSAVYGSVALVTIVLLFFHPILSKLLAKRKDWKPASVGEFVMESFFEVFEYVLSYFSNTLSFLRVGAFVLVHGGLMLAVFTMAGDSHAKIIIVVLGNILVLAIEALFTSIQAMRLEFYEIFSRCYKGEGKAFDPVNIQ
jgi:V/A-type H+-transporting ATPase subunit I